MRIAVFNQKGGVGKTTTAHNLAAALAQRGRAVLLIDLDPQAHLTSIHGEEPGDASASVFSFFVGQQRLISLERPWPGIGRLVPAHGELIRADAMFGKGLDQLTRLRHELDADKMQRDVIIDCCPYLGVLSLSAIFAADMVLAPVAADHLSVRGAAGLAHTLHALEPLLRRRTPRRYVLTRFNGRRRMCLEVADSLRANYGADLCDTAINENVALAEAPSAGQDIFSYSPESRGAQDYSALADELLQHCFPPAGGAAEA